MACTSPANRCLQRQVMLDSDRRCRGSAKSVLSSHTVTMAALVVLAGRLPGNAQPGGDFRPPDAEADSLVD
jgi:hypothetical protein